jgi:hypothetical protein
MFQTDELNRGLTKPKTGINSNGTVSDTLADNCRRLDSFVPPEWLFSFYAKRAIRGDLDMDNSSPFAEHMKSTIADAELIRKALPPESHSYTPKEQDEEENTTKTKSPKVKKSKEDKRLATFVNQMAKALVFKKKCEGGEIVDWTRQKLAKKVLIPHNTHELSRTVKYLAEKKLLMSVQVDAEALKLQQQDGSTPTDNFLKRVWDQATEKAKISSEAEEAASGSEEEASGSTETPSTHTSPTRSKGAASKTTKTSKKRSHAATSTTTASRTSARVKSKRK